MWFTYLLLFLSCTHAGCRCYVQQSQHNYKRAAIIGVSTTFLQHASRRDPPIVCLSACFFFVSFSSSIAVYTLFSTLIYSRARDLQSYTLFERLFYKTYKRSKEKCRTPYVHNKIFLLQLHLFEWFTCICDAVTQNNSSHFFVLLFFSLFTIIMMMMKKKEEEKTRTEAVRKGEISCRISSVSQQNVAHWPKTQTAIRTTFSMKNEMFR